MSVREQERRQREAERRINEAMSRADREVRGRVEARAQEATHRAEEIKRKIERGDVQPRPLPGVREDSMASAEYASGISEEAQKVVDAGGVMMKDMPLEGQPMAPERAEEDLAQRVTEDTGAGGDPHLHAERKEDEIAEEMTEDTDAGGDMNLHAGRKVDQMANEMFED